MILSIRDSGNRKKRQEALSKALFEWTHEKNFGIIHDLPLGIVNDMQSFEPMLSIAKNYMTQPFHQSCFFGISITITKQDYIGIAEKLRMHCNHESNNCVKSWPKIPVSILYGLFCLLEQTINI